MDRLLQRVFALIVRTGTLRVTTIAGDTFIVGNGSGPELALRFTSHSAQLGSLIDPELRFGEAYMNGTLIVEEGSIADVLALVMSQTSALRPPRWARPQWLVRYLGRRLRQLNPRSRSRRNVAHHYDLDGRLYALFLDADRQYSCAYFETADQSLDDAQLAKRRHLAAKLLLSPGQRVLDIGSGWGGLALYLARECGVDVTGLTLSVEQCRVAVRRAAAAGLSDRVRFHVRDYRQELGHYDRVVSVGMFEHVGINHYKEFFTRLKLLLAPDGVALLHSIGRMDGPGSTNPWIRKYIFLGGYIPALSEVLPVVERSKLWVTDVEILRLHYAETLKSWRHRFERNRDRLRAIYDERFCRMWEMYLVGSEVAFRRGGCMVFQMQLAKAVDSVPIRRDYMLDWEREHSAASERAA